MSKRSFDVLRRLIPRDGRFFELFKRSADNTLEGARLLSEMLEHCDDLDRKARHLKDIEHTGDEITHEIFRALNRTFVTPLDREDISQLASALDDVIDWIEEAARRMRLYHINETTPLAKRFGRVILDQSEQIAKAIPMLGKPKNAEELERATHEIHRLENEGDDLLAEAIAGLYEGVTEVPQLIKAMRWDDIYQLLEDATDKAEEVAVVLQNIAFKNA
jgi:predicted phosphate transport protein (TIGR00153 family)